MVSADFKRWAKEKLKGKWGMAIGVCIMAGLLGGGVDMVSGVFNPAAENPAGMLELASTGAWPTMVSVTAVSLLIALILGGALNLGLSYFFVGLVSGRDVRFGDVFARFKIWHKGLWMNVVMAFFIVLWTLLGVVPVTAVIVWLTHGGVLAEGVVPVSLACGIFAAIPGVIATYRYAMTPYLIAEFPDLTVMEAIRESKRLMQGKKWNFLCLNSSFIGWIFLVILTLGIANLWLAPYMNASCAAFYLEATGRGGLRYAAPTAE